MGGGGGGMEVVPNYFPSYPLGKYSTGYSSAGYMNLPSYQMSGSWMRGGGGELLLDSKLK